MWSNAYYTLVASLPALPPHLETGQIPMPRRALENRLKMLTRDDAETVEQWWVFLDPDRHRRQRTDEEVGRRHDELRSKLANPLARQMVAYQSDIRMIVSGLRRRRRDLPPPPGAGGLADQVRRNWRQPDFQLGWRYAWIADVDQRLGAGDCLAVERILLETEWNHWRRLAEHQHFSLAAVLLYLARWTLLSRWASHDAALGRQRLEQLVVESMHEYANLFE